MLGVSNAVFLKDFKKYRVPLALIGRAFDSSLSEASIMGDNEIGAYKSAKYLIDGGTAVSFMWREIQRFRVLFKG